MDIQEYTNELFQNKLIRAARFCFDLRDAVRGRQMPQHEKLEAAGQTVTIFHSRTHGHTAAFPTQHPKPTRYT